MGTQFSRLFPSLYRLSYQTRDWQKLAGILEETFDLLHEDIRNFSECWDPYRCEKKYLPYLAHKVGWLLDTSRSEALQRKTTRLIGQVFKKQGTKVGIIEAIRLLMGFEADIVDIWGEDGWRVGESELGEDTYLASAQGPNPYHFIVIIYQYLTEEEDAAVREIIDWMKPAWTHYTLEANAWILNESELNITTILGRRD